MSTHKMNFVKYNMYPMKVRIKMLQDKLIDLGYSVQSSGKRDKATIKALMDFQSRHNMTANGVVCEDTFNLLDF